MLSTDRKITQKNLIRAIHHPELTTSVYLRKDQPPLISNIIQLGSDIPIRFHEKL